MSYPKIERQRIERAIKSAARAGCNPYNSHPVASVKWTRSLRDAIRRGKVQ